MFKDANWDARTLNFDADIDAADMIPQHQQLLEHCKTNMAPYKRPRWIEFMKELPKTATGKIQRSALRYSAV